jgi:hypothetical protein
MSGVPGNARGQLMRVSEKEKHKAEEWINIYAQSVLPVTEKFGNTDWA